MYLSGIFSRVITCNCFCLITLWTLKENTLNKIYIYIFEYYQIHQNLSQTDHLQINGNLLKSTEIKDFGNFLRLYLIFQMIIFQISQNHIPLQKHAPSILTEPLSHISSNVFESPPYHMRHLFSAPNMHSQIFGTYL